MNPIKELGFPLVGIGASAGALDALKRLLPGLPPEPGFSLVVILHLAPGQPSFMAGTLQQWTKLPVTQVTEAASEIQPNHIYVIAPGTFLTIDGCRLVPEAAAGSNGAIDHFFHSLAESHGKLAIGVLLSGMNDDGCQGLAAIRQQGGSAIAQTPLDAQFGVLPQSALDAGLADFVLPADAIAAQLLALAGSPLDVPQPESDEQLDAQGLQEVLALLHSCTGHDFQHYKRPGIRRRLENRMQSRGTASVADYRSMLAHDGDEPARLLKELLIGVTGFFRDGDAFTQLRQTVLPELLEARSGAELRVWVPACSTGQEAYSLAMVLVDLARRMPQPPRIHIIASDIDEQALAVARAGHYPESIRDEIPEASLERYFVRAGKQYRVRQSLRDVVTFANHDLLHDPPFRALDLVSCRNVMIYLDRAMQCLVLQRLHGSLRPAGYLFLGSAESAEFEPELFERVGRPHRIYRALPGSGSATAARPAASMDEMSERLAASEFGREELQSNNDELSVHNAELTARLEDADTARDDLANLIASVDLATVFVDPALILKRYTPHAARIFNLKPRDIGRHLLDITNRLDYPELAADVAQTFETLQPLEREVEASAGGHYIVRVRPYRTGGDAILGAVLTFFDISERRVAQVQERQLASDQAFLLKLSDSLRLLTDPAQLLALGCRMLGEQLGVPQLAYACIDDGRYCMQDCTTDGAAHMPGEGPLAALGEAVLASWRAGHVAVYDVNEAAPMDGLRALAPGSGAMLAAVHRQGRHWRGFFIASQPAQRVWTLAQVALFDAATLCIGVKFERARAQLSLLASENRLRGLLRGFARAYWETDASGQPLADNLLDSVYPDDRAAILESWRRAVRSGGELDEQIRLRNAAGVWRQASMLATPTFDGQGDILKWTGCIIDGAEQPPLASGSI
ncbi:CheR family methyltransferase [Pseudoduganella sp. OTU4001]|uniref:CheR family methyltransferase n=1 Tax=Pseudoduganella sp. OTU4001 TaxID=3043854 RepID=UPI00313DD848